MKKKTIDIIVPCYNEEDVLNMFYTELSKVIDTIHDYDCRCIFVDDGSRDRTWEKIVSLTEKEEFISALKLSANSGHQNALLGGLITLKDYADAVISIDADLQDDINAIDGMLDRYYEGCDIVYGVRKKRDTDTFFKRFIQFTFISA